MCLSTQFFLYFFNLFFCCTITQGKVNKEYVKFFFYPLSLLLSLKRLCIYNTTFFFSGSKKQSCVSNVILKCYLRTDDNQILLSPSIREDLKIAQTGREIGK